MNLLQSEQNYISAQATFTCTTSELASDVDVEAISDLPKSLDDWKISLALDAATSMAEHHKVPVDSIKLSLKSIHVKKQHYKKAAEGEVNSELTADGSIHANIVS